MDQKKGMSRIRGIIILVLLAVMLVSGAMSIHSWVEDKRTGEEYERLAELARETTAQPYTEAVAEPGPAEPETEPYVSPINFEELMKENPEIKSYGQALAGIVDLGVSVLESQAQAVQARAAEAQENASDHKE